MESFAFQPNIATKWLPYCLQFTKPLVHLMLHFPVLCEQHTHTGECHHPGHSTVLNAELRGNEDISEVPA